MQAPSTRPKYVKDQKYSTV